MFIDVISGAFETQIQPGLVSSHNLIQFVCQTRSRRCQKCFPQEMVFEAYLGVGFKVGLGLSWVGFRLGLGFIQG